MKEKKGIIALSIGMSLLLGGCTNLDNTSSKDQKVNSIEAKKNNDLYVPVQDYMGNGFALPNGERTDKIAKAHRAEIEAAVKKFFKEKYKTDVIVHNVVGAVDGASVYVESIGELHFYTYAIVPIDVQNKKVMLNEVWSQEGQVEGAIMSGIYGIVYEEKIKRLNEYLDNFVSQNPVVGMRIEAVQKVSADGYSTPFYYLTVFDKPFETLFKMYIENSNISKEEINNELNKIKVDTNNLLITIHLFMKEKNVKPDKKILNTIVTELKNMEDLPPGSYSVFLHDNNIDKKTGTETNDNNLSCEEPDCFTK